MPMRARNRAPPLFRDHRPDRLNGTVSMLVSMMLATGPDRPIDVGDRPHSCLHRRVLLSVVVKGLCRRSDPVYYVPQHTNNLTLKCHVEHRLIIALTCGHFDRHRLGVDTGTQTLLVRRRCGSDDAGGDPAAFQGQRDRRIGSDHGASPARSAPPLRARSLSRFRSLPGPVEAPGPGVRHIYFYFTIAPATAPALMSSGSLHPVPSWASTSDQKKNKKKNTTLLGR